MCSCSVRPDSQHPRHRLSFVYVGQQGLHEFATSTRLLSTNELLACLRYACQLTSKSLWVEVRNVGLVSASCSWAFLVGSAAEEKGDIRYENGILAVVLCSGIPVYLALYACVIPCATSRSCLFLHSLNCMRCKSKWTAVCFRIATCNESVLLHTRMYILKDTRYLHLLRAPKSFLRYHHFQIV